jgi:tetratricopeptide (TPR) repeat protein
VNRSKRVEYLEKLVNDGKADSFAQYALALEYDKLERPSDAIAAFERLRASDPGYLPMYLMAGRLQLTSGHKSAALEWANAGIALAKQKGDSKAYGELSELLEDASQA